MPRPAFLELSPDEVRRRRARFFFEDSFAFRPAQFFETRFLPGIQKTLPGDRSHAAWKVLKADQICPSQAAATKCAAARLGLSSTPKCVPLNRSVPQGWRTVE
mmetsp:Transcript_42401/g.95828  ORF Transcript_42401/g.95828 Transcript_42401/m.95828 type:complete len:103 (-) Transcript_42401:1070-1378(-)